MGAKVVKKAAKKPRNRRAQDITLINLDALKRKVKVLQGKVGVLQSQMASLEWAVYLKPPRK